MADFFKITYIFKFHEKPDKLFELNLNPEILHIIQKIRSHPLEWTRLDYKRCSVCSLGKSHTYCPVAVNIADIAVEFSDIFSHEEVLSCLNHSSAGTELPCWHYNGYKLAALCLNTLSQW